LCYFEAHLLTYFSRPNKDAQSQKATNSSITKTHPHPRIIIIIIIIIIILLLKMRSTDRATLEIVVATYNRFKVKGYKVSNRIITKEIHGLVSQDVVGKIIKIYQQTGSIESLDPSIKDIRCMDIQHQHFLKSLVLTYPTMCTTGLQQRLLQQFGLLVNVKSIKRIIDNWRLPTSNIINGTFELDDQYPSANKEYIGRELTYKGKVRVLEEVDLYILKSAKLGLTKHSKSRFGIDERMKRIESFGQEHLNQTREASRISLDSDAWRGEKLKRWQSFVKGLSKKKIASHLRVYGQMQHILQVLMDEHGLKPERSCWLDALSARCLIPASGINCGCCDGCWARFVQTYILVKSASGVADSVVCSTMGGIFHSHPYKNYSLEEWSTMPESELASLLEPTSCWAYNTQYILPYLRCLNADRKGNKKLIPDYLAMMQVYGTRSKSAFLTVEGAYGIQAGVVVDRHVAREAREFGFVPAGSKDTEEISVMLRVWVPPTDFSRFNETIGGLKQLLGKGKIKEKKLAFEVEKQLGYKNIISSLLKKKK
jgi:endonuclease III